MNVLQALLGAPAEAFRDGRLVFTGQLSPQVLFLILLALAAVAWSLYRVVRNRTSSRAWWAVLVLRLALLAVLLFLLAGPALRTLRSRDEVFTAVLVDTSRSMAIEDVVSGKGTIARIEAVRQLLGEGGLLEELKTKGKVVVYTFDEESRRISAKGELNAEGYFTNIFRGVRDMEAELRGVPLAAVVLVTDGARNTGGTTEDASALLKARGVPLFTVGVGNASPPNDYEVTRVVAPKRVRRNSEIEITATLRHTGFNQPFDVTVNRGGAAVVTQTVKPDGQTDLDQIKLRFTPDHEGAANYTVEIAPADGEVNTVNNKREFQLEIQDDRLPVLYVEGSPRLEYRFLRRALIGDRDFRLVGLLRIGDKRFYVQGANESEAFLQKGFPTTPEQLFGFQAVILGDIEASYFTPAQLAMLEEFVRVRGGGLLMLGGVNSFGPGQYANTPVAKMLPFEVGANDGRYSEEQYKARVVQGIGVHPVMRLSLDAESNRTLWAQAPPLIGITPVGAAKTGALTLLTREGTDQPVFAVQNYGLGRVAAFTSGGSWYWRVSVPSEVEFHEKFWKQLVRWLAIGAKERLTVETDADVYAPRKPAVIRATALAKDLEPINDAVITATVTDPLGNQQALPMDWILSEEGVYQAQMIPPDEGDYRVSVQVEGWDSKPVETFFRVSEPTAEAADAGLKEDTLRQMAEATGGRYFPLAEADKLPPAIAETIQSAKVTGMKPVDHSLWDTPIWFALALGLMVSEWTVRRRSGLA